MAQNAKLGLTGKQLRDWIVAQLMWVDHGRLNTMGMAQYLNVGTNEVEAAAQIYEQLFPLTERLTHFLCNVVLALFLNPFSAILIAILIPITSLVQWLRRSATTALLLERQRAERQVCTLK